MKDNKPPLATIYTVKAKNSDILWTFRYDLHGHLKSFVIEDGHLSGKQLSWLFMEGNFPGNETVMKTRWIKKMKSNFEITIGSPDLSFTSFWNRYNHKVKKVATQRTWKRLGKKDRLEALKAIKSYDKYLFRKKISKANPSTYLNQRYWEDSFGSIH